MIPLDLKNAALQGNIGIKAPDGLDENVFSNTLTAHQNKYAVKFDSKVHYTYEFKQPVLMRGYALRAADNEASDPKTWTV
mgnify:CR=1 FL=1